ncbi:TPA: sulfite exporter TauE/SafE family protein [Candidatus Bathyarchaeota archaeon]|nr:sulfite exporter TauE/SafE family protein [Candidatus Bathyarchaeota archaeon]
MDPRRIVSRVRPVKVPDHLEHRPIMTSSYPIWAFLILIVFLGGFIGSMISGGSVLVFAILAFLNVPVKTAIGTLKFAIMVLCLFSAVTFLRGGAVNVKLVPPLMLSSLAGALLGTQIILSLPNEIVNAIVILLICLGTASSLRLETPKNPESASAKPGRILPVLTGLLLGINIGMLGIASALITISVLISLFRLRMIEANGTSKMIIFANNLVACVAYAINNNVDLLLGVLIAIPIAIGSWAGAKTALKMKGPTLRMVFVGISLLTIVKLLSEII